MLELRRTRMPDGGFVTIYRDVTEHEQADRALSAIRAAMQASHEERSKFAAIIDDGLRAPATALPYAADDAAWPTQSADNLVTDPGAPPADLPPRAVPRTRVLLGGNIVAGQGRTATLLRQAGHHVDVAPDGPAMIESMRTAPYDLALLDLHMAGVNGKQVATIIRGLPEPACATPAIAWTTDISPDEGAAAKAVGLDGMLTNPISLTDLLGILRDHVWARSATAAHADVAPACDRGLQPVPAPLSIERINALRATLPAATLANAVEDCLVDLERRLPALRRSLTARSPAAVIAHAQVMVSMAATFGMTALEAHLRAIVTAAREGDLAPLGTSVVADLNNDYEESSRILRDILRTEMV
jgi:CheY-like chemotaxis protein